MKIKDMALILLALVFIGLFTALGCWQIGRAHQKEALLTAFAERSKQTPLSFKQLSSQHDIRFYRVALEGRFDNQHTFLLDNKIFQGKIGYEVYTPFVLKDEQTTILIDRGFVPMQKTRQQLPGISSIFGQIKITGMLNLPPAYVALGKMQESNVKSFPLRIEFINLTLLNKLLKVSLFPLIVSIDPHSALAYPIEWKIVTMKPERHLGYAVQWFAMALTLLILSIVLYVKQQSQQS